MSNTPPTSQQAVDTPPAMTADMKFEIAVLPVSDVDRAKAFYAGLGWKLDMDFSRGDFRVIQFTPPGSSASIIFGRGITSIAPGSTQGLYLIVSDIDIARAGLIAAGANVSEVFHDGGGIFHHAGTEGRISGPAPQRHSYGSYASFADPDGNGWWLQEVTSRLPGHALGPGTRFESPIELARALRRARAAYDVPGKRSGLPDTDWPTWFADYLVAEQAGTALPT